MTTVKMPQLGETIIEGTILKWLKAEGDTVTRDEPLFEISTDKVDTEVPSPVAGTVTKILVDEGATVAVGTIVMEIDDGSGEATAEVAQAPAPAEPIAEAPAPAAAPVPVAATVLPDRGPRSQILSPVVRRLAKERGIDLSTLIGTGTGGRITRADVLAASGGPAVAAGRLEHERPPDAARLGEEPPVRLLVAVVAGDDRHPRRRHEPAGRPLVAHPAMHLARRPDEDEAGLLHRVGEVGVLAQEAVAGVDGVGPRRSRRAEDRVDREVREPRLGGADPDRLVGLADVAGRPVRLGEDGHGGKTHDAAGAEHPYRDLPPIGDQDLPEERHRATSAQSPGPRHRSARTVHRELLGALSLVAYETVKELMAAAVEEKGFRPGMVSVVQTRATPTSTRWLPGEAGPRAGSGSRCRMWMRERPRSSSDTRCWLFSDEEVKPSRGFEPSPHPRAVRQLVLIAPWELRVGEMRVYYGVEEEPKAVVVITAVGIKERNRILIAGRDIEP